MQYKRWLSRRGAVANYLKELSHIEENATQSEEDAFSASSDLEDEELNQDLIDWLIK